MQVPAMNAARDDGWPRMVNQGRWDNPWIDGREMRPEPEVHESAVVERTEMWPWTVIGPHCLVADSIIRDYAYAVGDNQIHNADIGKFCNIATGVRINPTNHPMWRASLHHFTYRSRSHHMGADDPEIFAWRRSTPVAIGPDVWIGHNAILLPGVTVGAGAVIGAGAIVTRPVPAYTIVAGNPARVIRRRVDEATEAAFLRIAWWDWPHDRLAAALPDFRALDAAAFAAKYDPGA